MTTLEWIGLLFAAALGAMVAFFRRYYMPPERLRDFTEIPYMPSTSPELPRRDDLEVEKDKVPPPEIKEPSRATLENLCSAIRDFEGKPGDASYRNNNPGNVRYHKGGYLPMYGEVKCSPAGFAVFPTYEQGWLYLSNFLKTVIHNHPTLTLKEFIGGKGEWKGYAPASDSNPVEEYATFLRNRLGVDKDFRIKNITYT